MTPDAKAVPEEESRDGPLATVTGGTGFLGRYIVAELLKAGWRVRLLVRRDPIHPQLPDLEAELVFGDLSNERALEKLCTGADAIIHAAGLIKARDRAAFFKVNEEGSAALARAAAQVAPATPIIVLSSLAAREPELSDYAASKNAGETAIFKISKGPVTILRPSAIYGRWDRETFPLFQMGSRGIVFTPKSKSARVCLIHAEDVARAVVAITGTRPGGEIYELSDAKTAGYDWSEIVNTAAEAINTSPRRLQVPEALLQILGLLSEKSAYFLGNTPILTRGKIREMLHEDWGSAETKQPPTDLWKPRINLQDGFRDTANWYRDNGWM